jgi:hypothetical protein
MYVKEVDIECRYVAHGNLTCLRTLHMPYAIGWVVIWGVGIGG